MYTSFLGISEALHMVILKQPPIIGLSDSPYRGILVIALRA
jgi:hypothetical protein